MTSEKDFIIEAIHHVLPIVNTARIEKTVTSCIVMKHHRNVVIGARLRAFRKAAGFSSAPAAAQRYGWKASTLTSHENGTRPIKYPDAEEYAAKLSRPGAKIEGRDIIYGPNAKNIPTLDLGISRVPVVGMVGAGAAVEPEFDQTSVLYEIELQMLVPKELIAFQVLGDSMIPRYDDGDVILVWREQKRALESFYGHEAAVRTTEGRRYLKTILHGRTPDTVLLQSHNAKLIEGVRLEWIGEIYSTIRSDQVNRLEKSATKKPTASRHRSA